MLLLNFFVYVLIYVETVFCEDYYELLGVKKSASTQDIRKSFKKLALTLHPDKNQDDQSAQDKFVKITRAYEVLKDEAKRKQYDLHGDDDAQRTTTNYRSYYYYEHQFGLYDDDPNVITLSGSDFSSSVEMAEQFGQWIVKFYSPLCASCHHAAPAYSKLASELSGAVSFGAVNCEDDWNICNRYGIRSYPSYVIFPSVDTLAGARNTEQLKNFIISKIESKIFVFNSHSTWETVGKQKKRWLLILGPDDVITPEYKILSAMLHKLVVVALFDCSAMDCPETDISGGIRYKFVEYIDNIWSSIAFDGNDPKEILAQVLELLPPITKLNEFSFHEHKKDLEKGSQTPLLVYFHLGPKTNLDTEIKKLTSLLRNFKIGSVNCGRFPLLCSGLGVSRYPLFAVFKSGGGKEFYHGTHTIQGVASFALESSEAVNFEEFGPIELDQKLKEGALLVDFYAPWCPPCLKLIPELRKASLSFLPSVITFASVDCTIHSELCKQHRITTYPTTLLFNSTKRPLKMDSRTAPSIKEFVYDSVSPKVVDLTEDTFYTTVGKKIIGEMWLVYFFMPWCAPCQQMDPQYRKLAKTVSSDLPELKLAKVNCEEEVALCRHNGVKSYPHLRLYPIDSVGMNTVMIYNGYARDAQTLRRWLYNFIPSPLTTITPEIFQSIITSKKPWLIDFYAPWCGHCVAFEPDFITVSKKLENKVSTGKLDCERYSDLCNSLGINSYPTLKVFSPSLPRGGVAIDSQNPYIITTTVEQYLNQEITHDEL